MISLGLISLTVQLYVTKSSFFQGQLDISPFLLHTEKTEELSRLSNVSCSRQRDKNKPYIHMRQETNTAFGSSLWFRRLNCLKSITWNFEMGRLGWKREPVFSWKLIWILLRCWWWARRLSWLSVVIFRYLYGMVALSSPYQCVKVGCWSRIFIYSYGVEIIIFF